MDWCYHGTVDETLAVLDGDRVVARPGALGPQVPVTDTTAVVPFNDADALDRRLGQGDVACLLMEPALTNIGIVLPEEGYLDAVREITRRHGVLLINDETHTLCAGPGGATAAWGLDPDLLVVGKPIGGGNALALAAGRATLSSCLRVAVPLAERFTDGVSAVIAEHGLAWHVQRGWAAARSTGSARRPATARRQPPPSTRTPRRSSTCGASTAACC